jgi:hypothetical protein
MIHQIRRISLRLGRFCYDSASNLQTVALCAMVGPTVCISRCDIGDMPQPADFGAGFLSVPAAICQQFSLGEVPRIANGLHAEIRRIRRPCFNIVGCATGTLWTVALKRPIFKRKKGFTNISLGLNYCSMGSSWPRSRDTVPLTCTTFWS